MLSVSSTTLTWTPARTVMPWSLSTAAGSASSRFLKPASLHALAESFGQIKIFGSDADVHGDVGPLPCTLSQRLPSDVAPAF